MVGLMDPVRNMMIETLKNQLRITSTMQSVPATARTVSR